MDAIKFVKRASIAPWFILGGVAMIAIAIIIFQKQKIDNVESEKENIAKALTDTVKVFRRQDGSLKATITAFQTQKKKDFLRIQSGDKEIQRLQAIVKEYGSKLNSGTAATFTATTSATATSPTMVLAGDTIKFKDTVYLYPTYVSKFQLGKWISGNTVATKESTTVNLRTYNEYDVVVGESKGGFFKNREVYADVITHSPYDSINKLRAYKVSVPPQKRLGLGLSAGYGFNFQAKPMIYIGLGINYNLINIK